MIKNVVLDIGNVMVTYYPDYYLSQWFDRKGELEYFNHICFKGPEWKAGDLGKMSRSESIQAICDKYPADAEMIHTVMDHCDEMLRPSLKNTALLRKLREGGINVYYLSNTNPSAFEHMSTNLEFYQYMIDGIASFREGLLKPDRRIFELFLERFGKNAEECVFVDDTPQNVEAAREVGFSTVLLRNIDDLAQELCRFPELNAVICETK
ncbi:MAG: HAD family phosphatase [Ruminococcaceae bacterium]|nr:HAD family phosphatase [Oscillospiraceae bacterium]